MSSRIFDKNLRTVKERIEHIDSILNKSKIREEFLGDVKRGLLAQDSRSGHYLETVANYLLESPDIESGRKINNTFYPNEKYYWSKTSIAKCLKVSSDKLENYPEEQRFEIGQDTIRVLFKFDRINQKVIRNFILLGLVNKNKRDEASNNNQLLLEALNWLGEEIWNSMSEQDRKLVLLFDGRNSISYVANLLGVSHQNISKKIKKICKNAEKWLQN